jgi:2-methylcitrate dehydratase
MVAQQGVYCALLAQNGVTGPLGILEHPRGMKAIFPKLESGARGAAPEQANSYIMKAQVKTYPCVATAQGAVAAALEMHRVQGGSVDRLRRVRVVMPDYPNIREHQQDRARARPISREAADHSLAFLVAVSLIDGALGPAQFENERWVDPKVRELMDRLEFVTDPALARRAPLTYSCAIEAHDNEGRNQLVEVLNPFSEAGIDVEAVIRKFRLATSHIEPSAAERVIERIMRLDQPGGRLDFLDVCAGDTRN